MKKIQILVSIIFFPLLMSFFYGGCGGDGGGSGGDNLTPTCFDRAVFGDPSESEYVLPYPAGEQYEIIQSYCYQENSHYNSLAYDFLMPMGSDIVAARAGIVLEIRDDLPDMDLQDPSMHNHIFIKHEDGTIAFYGHLQQWGLAVHEGEAVDAGQYIAASGSSGVSIPLLHFGVFPEWPPVDGNDLAINFNNADGPLDSNNGLIAGESYLALPI
jgi:murein DD-endopeptidase MepM/ murein hydrolase activator NlpD